MGFAIFGENAQLRWKKPRSQWSQWVASEVIKIKCYKGSNGQKCAYGGCFDYQQPESGGVGLFSNDGTKFDGGGNFKKWVISGLNTCQAWLKWRCQGLLLTQ